MYGLALVLLLSPPPYVPQAPAVPQGPSTRPCEVDPFAGAAPGQGRLVATRPRPAPPSCPCGCAAGKPCCCEHCPAGCEPLRDAKRRADRLGRSLIVWYGCHALEQEFTDCEHLELDGPYGAVLYQSSGAYWEITRFGKEVSTALIRAALSPPPMPVYQQPTMFFGGSGGGC